MNRKESFDNVAQIYDRIRPCYPPELISDIIENTKVTEKSNILEIGAGTGKATLQLAEKGLRVHCVEPGQNLVNILLDKCCAYPVISADIASFEQWETQNYEAYDLVCSAQAFHWIDPEIRYKKSHSLLKDKGHLALFWYTPGEGSSEAKEEIEKAITACISEYSKRDENGKTFQDIKKEREEEIASSGLFDRIKVFQYEIEQKHDAESYIDVINSYSAYAVLKEETKSMLNDKIKDIILKHGGYIKSTLIFTLYIAEKI